MAEYNVHYLRFRYTMEEIIAKITSEDDNSISIENPVTLVPDPSKPNSLRFLPWSILCGKREMTFPRGDFLLIGPVPESLAKGYVGATSGIEIANVVPINRKLNAGSSEIHG
jgi:hypothetical protein